MLDFAVKWAPSEAETNSSSPSSDLPHHFLPPVAASPHPPDRHQRQRPASIGRSVHDEIGNYCAAAQDVLASSQQHALTPSRVESPYDFSARHGYMFHSTFATEDG